MSAVPVLALLSAPLLLAGCGAKDDSAKAADTIAVTAADDSCQVATTALPAGKHTFTVTNKGAKVTEVYVYGEQGGKYTKVVAEVENIGPGLTRDMTVELGGGEYEIACKPGQTGDGIRTAISVGGQAPASAASEDAGYDREVEIDATDTALEHADALTATTGEKIEFKLHNEGTKEMELEVLDPTGKVVAETEAAAGATGEVVVELSSAGTWQIKVEGATTDLQAPVTVR